MSISQNVLVKIRKCLELAYFELLLCCVVYISTLCIFCYTVTEENVYMYVWIWILTSIKHYKMSRLWFIILLKAKAPHTILLPGLTCCSLMHHFHFLACIAPSTGIIEINGVNNHEAIIVHVIMDKDNIIVVYSIDSIIQVPISLLGGWVVHVYQYWAWISNLRIPVTYIINLGIRALNIFIHKLTAARSECSSETMSFIIFITSCTILDTITSGVPWETLSIKALKCVWTPAHHCNWK